MRALVTGASGFLGGTLVGVLAERGHDVAALVRPTSDLARLEGIDVDLRVGDVTDRASVEAALEGVEVVFHCAASVPFGRSAAAIRAVNVDGTTNVLESAADRGVRAVHVSSLAALGPSVAGEPPADESWWNPAAPATPYEETKREAHLLARGLAAGGADVRLAMPGGIYGFGDVSTMAQLIKSYALFPWPIGYLPEVRQSVVSVRDCADALIRIATDGERGGEYVVVADVLTLREWITVIAEVAGNRPPRWWVPTRWVQRAGDLAARIPVEATEQVEGLVVMATNDNAYSGARLRRELGWDPAPVRKGMAEMVIAIQAAAEDARRRRRIARAQRRSTRLRR